jgi:serine/threonine-protein kinase
MERVRGKTVSELLPKQGFPWSRFFDMAIPLSDAVATAHQQGITHRDLKPENVMLSDEGCLKVLDFGLAKPSRGLTADGAASGLPTATRTREGTIVGTPSYMSPEQAEGKAVDRRSDIFSLGILFYEMLSGRRPFRGESATAIVSSILKDTPPSLMEPIPDMPRALSKMVLLATRRSSLSVGPDAPLTVAGP